MTGVVISENQTPGAAGVLVDLHESLFYAFNVNEFAHIQDRLVNEADFRLNEAGMSAPLIQSDADKLRQRARFD